MPEVSTLSGGRPSDHSPATVLHKFGARYYDATTGRFTQPDLSGQEANTYAYAECNPVNKTDPSGLLRGRTFNCLGKQQVFETRPLCRLCRKSVPKRRGPRCLGKPSHRKTSQHGTGRGFPRQNGGMRLLGYTRVSPTSQDAQLQLDALVSTGVQKRDVFADVTSGSKTAIERPGMKRLLDYAQTGDTVVVWRVDRLGRSLIDVLNTVNLLRENGVQVRSISDGIDPATSTGRLMLNMLATLAEYERELIVERVNAGIAAARQGGTRFGRPLSDPAVIADKLALATEARAKGRTAEDAARLVGWSRATLYRHQQALAIRESSRDV